MRDPGPLRIHLLIDHHFRSEIFFDQLVIQAAEDFRAQCLSAFCHLMGLFFELRKHRLAIDGALEILQILVQEGEPLRRILGLFQELLDQKVLIDSGRHFRDEQGILGILRRLVFDGMPGVHGVPHLMRDRGDTVQRACKIRHDIRLGIIGSGGICSSLLSFVGENIDPAAGKSISYDIRVVCPQDGHGIQDHLLRLLISIVLFHPVYERRIDVIIVQLIKAEQALAKFYVPVHSRHMSVNGLDQVVINMGRDIVVGHRHFPGRAVMTKLCLCGFRLDCCRIGGCQRIAVTAEGLIVIPERILAQRSVRLALQQDIVGLVQFMKFAICIRGGFERHVRIAQVLSDLLWRTEDLAEAGQDSLLRSAQNMRLLLEIILHDKGVVGQDRIRDDLFQLAHIYTEDLRLSKGICCHCLDIFAVCARIQGLCPGTAHIFAAAQHGIGEQIIHFPAHQRSQFQVFVDRLRIRQLPLVFRGLPDQIADFLKLFLKLFIRVEKRTEIPCVPGIDLISLP